MRNSLQKEDFNKLLIFPLVLLLLLLSGIYKDVLATANIAPSLQQNQVVIRGTVVSAENNEPMPGVSVVVQGSDAGTMTNSDGEYELPITEGAILVFSFIGYESQEVPIDGSETVIRVSLQPDVEQMEEVVVIGYGTQRKSHLTGSISKVTNEQLDQIPVARMDEALAGHVSGVNIQMTDPVAGAAPTIRVRGTGSITAGAEPLIVLDGVPVSSDFLGSIDMNDVASIEVLKDAASAAIYGSRGGNGVIMVTTKQGRAGQTKFSFNSYVSHKSVPRNEDVFQTVGEWSDFVRTQNGELTDVIEYIQLLGTETDWQDVMFDGGMLQSYSLSAMGGSEKTRYRASGSYLNDEGVLLTDNYEKYNLRLNLETKINKVIDFGLMLNPSYTSQRRFPIGVHDALRQSPWLPLYHDENTIRYVDRENYPDIQVGDYAMERHFDNYEDLPDISATSNANAMAKVLERDERDNTFKLFANAYLRLNITDGLSFKTSIGGDYYNRKREHWTGSKADRRGASVTESRYTNDINTHIVNENTLSYDKEFGKHEVNAVAGVFIERWDYNGSEIIGTGFDFDYIRTINAAGEISEAATEKAVQTLLSYLSRINYAFDDRYLVSVSARADGSSRFGEDSRYGFFPAFSAGWRISEEPFLQDNQLFTDVKLRFSYGATGNNSGIGNYDHIALLSPVGAVMDGEIVSGFNPANIRNPELRWEKSVGINPGIDIGLKGGRFRVTLDYYNRSSEDLLLSQQIPSVTGFDGAIVNLGKVENKGFEIELVSRNIANSSLNWTTSVNFSRNKNTLVDFAGASGLISSVDDKRPAEWIALKGHSISSFYGYVADREIDLQYIDDPYYPIGAESQDIYVRDLDGDGQITTDDRTILGSPYPDFVWSINNSFQFGNFDLSFMFQGSHGAEVRNIEPQYFNNQFSGRQDYTSDFPDEDLVRQRIFTDDIIMDASYVSLRNFNLGYRLPAGIARKVGLSTARVYFSAQNLLYLMPDGYIGFNPEGINEGEDNPLTYGYQRGAAPIYRTLSLGLNFEF